VSFRDIGVGQELQFQAITDIALSLSLLLLLAWSVLLVIRTYPTRVGVQFYALALAIAAAVLFTLADYYLLNRVFPEDSFYTSWIAGSMGIRFLLSVLSLGWIATVYAMRQKLEQVESDFRLQADAASLLREAELFKLRQQLQPHFLYNSLNAINALIFTEPEKAQEMTGKLSEFLRSSVKRESGEMIPLAEELAHMETYLAIEEVRFGDRLIIRQEQNDTEGALIPPFLLQPLLENAVKFGLYGKEGTVAIDLQIRLEDGMLTIRVTNPYDPASLAPSGTGFGLEGIRRRLFLLFARTDLLEARQEDRLFTTTLKIPQQYV